MYQRKTALHRLGRRGQEEEEEKVSFLLEMCVCVSDNKKSSIPTCLLLLLIYTRIIYNLLLVSLSLSPSSFKVSVSLTKRCEYGYHHRKEVGQSTHDYDDDFDDEGNDVDEANNDCGKPKDH